MQNVEWLIVGTAATSALLLIGHWGNCPRPMSKLWRYVYGVTAIIVGFSIWRWAAGDWQAVVGLGVISVVGGLAVFAAYGWDYIVTTVHKAAMAELTDDELKE